MASLWKRATPSQYRTLRIVAGAVENAAHAHGCDLPHNFARSVAKRATGTLTAQWPDVLAAKRDRRQKLVAENLLYSPRARNAQTSERSDGGRQTFKRRSPLRRLWADIARELWHVKRSDRAGKYEAYIHVLRLIDKAARKEEAAMSAFISQGDT